MRWKIIRVLAFFGLEPQDVKYAIRSFLLAFFPLFIPGALGWLNDWTQWAPGRPYPDFAPVAAGLVAAVVAGVVAVFTLIVRGIEGKFGLALLRPNPPQR
jgi:hypothetical protein